MTVRWPGKIAPGQVSDLLWYFPDVLPTVAELAGTDIPEDVDGMSILPELIGEKSAGRKQETHEYLYWEIGTQVAIRMENWKAIQPGAKRGWELYNLDDDLSEAKNVANDHPEVLTQLRLLAAEAHEEAEEGTFFDRDIHERDRRAKFGNRPVPTKREVNSIPSEGLIPRKSLKIARVSSESGGNQKQAVNAIDGDPRTHWHTSFSPEVDKHPHELVIDLGKELQISGVRYLARQDGGWNGAVAEFEVFVSNSSEESGERVSKTRFKKLKTAQENNWQPKSGRYLLIRILSEVNGGPWASISELGIIGK